MKSIYDYRDYRVFLQDWYAGKKQQNVHFSYQRIAQVVGFKSRSHFPQICKGDLKLSGDQIYRMAECVGLDEKESAFFALLVRYTDAGSTREKKSLAEQMRSFVDVNPRELEHSQHLFYHKWYYPAIWNILFFYPFSGDYETLAEMVHPPVTPTEAKNAIRTLEKLELISRDPTGRYRSCENLISGKSSVFSPALAGYAAQMIDRARESIDNLPKDERSISAVGFSVSPETFGIIQEEIRALRKRIMHLAKNDPHPMRAYHFNVQVFPISQPFRKMDE